MTEIDMRCPVCNQRMVERTNRENGSTFLGCVGYPDCTETRAIPEYVKLRRAGHTPLPGMD